MTESAITDVSPETQASCEQNDAPIDERGDEATTFRLAGCQVDLMFLRAIF